ncbi:hypothetical protein DPMN_194805 [Dreissena polymorpha]|uniref:Uncharacterized protein n=1 Tax=Dreissena polymorpha TaxID=45954 RepID=A0A9D4B7Q9_DREPO|nr:hypothetical protein DPMN_194805 [Dreissena polymorpha]
MLEDVNLPTLQERRHHQSLTFLYKVEEKQVRAINIEHYLKRLRQKHTMRSTNGHTNARNLSTNIFS